MPSIQKIEVLRQEKVRRSKLYYVRKQVGQKTKKRKTSLKSSVFDFAAIEEEKVETENKEEKAEKEEEKPKDAKDEAKKEKESKEEGKDGKKEEEEKTEKKEEKSEK